MRPVLHLTSQGVPNGEPMTRTPTNRTFRFGPLLPLLLLVLLGWLTVAQGIYQSEGRPEHFVLRSLDTDNVQIIRTGKAEVSPVRPWFEHDREISNKLDLGLPPSSYIALIAIAVSDNFVIPAGISAACIKMAPYLARAPPSEGI